jgi:hypothetical protein
MSAPTTTSFISAAASALIIDPNACPSTRHAIGYCAQAIASAQEVTDRKHAPLKRAQERLAIARRFWARAVEKAAPASEIALVVEAGLAARAAIEAASKIVAEAKTKKLRITRAYALKGMNTREAARKVAEILLAGGFFTDLPSAMVGLAAEVQKEVPFLGNASPDHVFNAWLRLDPIA